MSAVRFADPYKRCRECGGWITGYVSDASAGDVDPLTPCGHALDYDSVCPSWSPVDGCTCRSQWGRVEHGIPPGPYPPGVVL